MKAKPQFVSIFMAACVFIFLSLPAFAHPANPPQDPGATQTQSGPQDKKQDKKKKAGTGPGKDAPWWGVWA